METVPKTSSNSLLTLLKQLYADNFVTYYKSHAYHFNVEGPTFAQDHELLNEIYDFLWAQHDMLGEQIRQMDKPVISSLKEILSMADIKECTRLGESSKTMFTELNSDFEELMSNAQTLYDEADMQCCGGLATFVGDYLKDLSKLNWKVKAITGKSFK
jgi:starvation-inducible DNA-binding protein